KYSRALESYQKAVDLISPRFAVEYLEKIKKLRQEQKLKEALELYEYVLSIRPEAGMNMLFGDQSFNEKDWNKALSFYKKAYELQENPDEHLKYNTEKYPNKEYERFIVRRYIQEGLNYPE